jgi:transketolase
VIKIRIYYKKHGFNSEKNKFLTYSNVTMNKIDVIDFQKLQALRIKILKACSHSNEGHVPSAFSILDILYSLYILLPKTSNIDFTKNDIFVLSKGHAALALYAILEEANIIGSEWVDTFGDFESNFGGHPDMNKIPGVRASTGSLGHGLPITLGKILAKRTKKIEFRAYCLIGDGELNEGSIWESLMLASHHSMKELTVIIDSNRSGDRALNLGSLESKFNSLGFDTKNVDGHSHKDLVSSFTNFHDYKPTAVIAQTIKGYGISELENNPAWHHAAPTQEQLATFIKDLM